MTIAVIMDCLDCCEVEYSLIKTKGSHFPGDSTLGELSTLSRSVNPATGE